MKRCRNRGFTLIELITSLAIVAVLLGILLPVLVSSMNSVRRTQCLTNLHNLSYAFQLYRTDFDDYFPPIYAGATTNEPGHELQDTSRQWTGLILPYLKTKEFLFCPARETPFGTEITPTDNLLFSGYFYNKNLGELLIIRQKKKTIYRTINESKLEFPARTVCIGEGRIGLLASSTPDTEGNEVFRQYETVTALTLDELEKLPPGGRRHNGGANYLLTDGHTRWYSASDFKNGDSSSPTLALISK